MCVYAHACLLFVLARAVDGHSGLAAMPPSRRELDACVSMILLQLPFPPLPVLALNGHGREAVASSLAQSGVSVPLRLHGMKGEFGQTGPAKNLLDHYRLDAAGIAAEVQSWLAS